MNKILLVARREFLATAGTRGFIIGLLVMPAMLSLVAVVGPRIMNARSPQVRGAVAIIDPTGRLASALRAAIAPEAITARRTENARRAVAGALGGAAGDDVARQAAAQPPPVIDILERAGTANPEQEKQWLLSDRDDGRRLALIVVHPDAVARGAANADFGGYDLFASRGLDAMTESVLYESMGSALVTARLAANGLDRAIVEATMRVPRPASVIVTAAGERPASRGFTRMLPFILGLFLFVGVIIGGQTLMTSTIEEKSSRVVEVLLSAVSPFDLMAGKLLGQLAVGLLVTGVYIGLGLLTLYSFAMLGLVDLMLVVYLVVFFLITYLFFGALMMAVGAAVNQMADAQSLMQPIMIMLLLPYMFAPMIGRAPNSTFSIVISFLPPFNTFAMLSRLASDAPPPAWQVWLTALVGLAAAYAAIWFAAKVFRIGLLMHGKPPNVATLVRWARAA